MLVTERYLSGERWRANLERLVGIYRSRRDAMLTALVEHFPANASWTHPAGGFYVWVTLPDYLDTQAMLAAAVERDRKSTRLNSSHITISYAVFCLKKKKKKIKIIYNDKKKNKK